MVRVMNSSNVMRTLPMALVFLAMASRAAAQNRGDCTAMSKEVENTIAQSDACSMQESAISALADRWLKVRLNVCREAPSFYDDGYLLADYKSYLRSLRDRACATQKRGNETAPQPQLGPPYNKPGDFNAYQTPRFFSDDVNQLLWENREDQMALGGKVLYRGQPVRPAELYELALNRFLGLAEQRHISQHSITRALFEGRLNPEWDDLTMVYQAVLNRNGGSGTPASAAQAWNAMFGAMSDLPRVRTMVDGQMREMTGLDIGRRLKDRYRSQQSPEALLLDTSPYVYFGLRDGREEVSGFRKDYAQLRGLSLDSSTAALEIAAANEHRFVPNAAGAVLIADVRLAGSNGAATLPACGPTPSKFQGPLGGVLYSLSASCLRPFTVDEQLGVAGLASGLMEKCSYPVDPVERARVADFLVTNWFGALLGSDYSNPNIGRMLANQAESLVASRIGRQAAQGMRCDGATAQLSSSIAAYLARTSEGPGGLAPRFVRGCVAHYGNRYSTAQCSCMADAARAIVPGIHQQPFSAETYREVMQRNPAVGGEILLKCGIATY